MRELPNTTLRRAALAAASTLALAAPAAAQTLATQTLQRADIAGLIAVNPGNLSANAVGLVADSDRGGTFRWRTGSKTTQVTGDPSACYWYAPSAASTGASGAWERQLVNGELPALACTGANDAAKINAALTWGAANAVRAAYLSRDTSWPATVAIPASMRLDGRNTIATKTANGEMLTALTDSALENITLNGGRTWSGTACTGFTGRGAVIDGPVSNTLRINFRRVSVTAMDGYGLEIVSTAGSANDGAGTLFRWDDGPLVDRCEYWRPAIKLPDSENALYGNRIFSRLSTNGGNLIDVAGARITRLRDNSAFAFTMGDAANYVNADPQRIVQIRGTAKISAITRGATTTIDTATAHGLTTGDKVILYDIGGTTALNASIDTTVGSGTYRTPYAAGNQLTVTVVDPDTFTVPVNSSGYGAFTGGGVVENISTHIIRGQNHDINIVFGATQDGSTKLTLGPAVATSKVSVPSGTTFVDKSGSATNQLNFSQNTGAYSPTSSATSNADSVVTSGVWSWYRIGSIVTIFGEIALDATALSNVQWEWSLPIATDFGGSNEAKCAGGQRNSDRIMTAAANSATDKIQMYVTPTATSVVAVDVMCSYRVN